MILPLSFRKARICGVNLFGLTALPGGGNMTAIVSVKESPSKLLAVLDLSVNFEMKVSLVSVFLVFALKLYS